MFEIHLTNPHFQATTEESTVAEYVYTMKDLMKGSKVSAKTLLWLGPLEPPVEGSFS